jgi:hypothetical protein
MQTPAAVLAPPAADNINGFGHTPVAKRIHCAEVIQGPQDIVMPPGRERNAYKLRIHDSARTVGSKKPVGKQKIPAALRCRAHIPVFPAAVMAVVMQTFEDVDRGVNGRMGCTIWLPAIEKLPVLFT